MTGSAEFPVTSSQDGTRIQYYFSENEVAGSDFENNIVWNDLNQNDLPLSLPGITDKYLYVKTEAPKTGQGSTVYVNSFVKCIEITYEQRVLNDPQIRTEADHTVNEDGKTKKGNVIFTVSQAPDAVIAYTYDKGGITLTRVSDTLRKDLNQKVSGSVATMLKDGTDTYIRANGIWYRCNCAGEVLEYQNSIKLTDEKLAGDGSSISIAVAADGYLPKCSELIPSKNWEHRR